MAVPKKRQSQARSRKRRSHDALTLTNLRACPSCSEMIKSHRVCPHCGNYDNKKIIAVKTA